jgi:chorismate-pyruvate lyase
MNLPVRIASPSFNDLCALFSPVDYLAGHEFVAPGEVPPPYHGLLVHRHHMTVTVEKYHGDLVNVRILERWHAGDFYARKILLALQKSGKVVQFGIARVNLHYCSDAVRDAILAGNTPLGRILIQHNVLRRVEPAAFLRILPGAPMMKWFGLEEMVPTYGRVAVIHCDGRPAVEVVEIVAPV